MNAAVGLDRSILGLAIFMLALLVAGKALAQVEPMDLSQRALSLDEAACTHAAPTACVRYPYVVAGTRASDRSSHEDAANRATDQPDEPIDDDSLNKLFDSIQSSVNAGLIAGAVVAVVHLTESGPAYTFSQHYGQADREQGIDVDVDETLFRLASISKLITATAVMQLVEKGQLRLEDDVNAILQADPVKALRIPATFQEPVRLKHLLTHSAGFETNMFGYYLAGDPKQPMTLTESLAAHIPSRVRPPVTNFEDGRGASYSDWGMSLAGHLVELKSGQLFADYVDEHIFKRCGMTHSTFREVPRPPNAATGYEYLNFGLAPHPFEYFSPIGPAGSLSTSASDMTQFMIAHLQHGLCANGKRILKAETTYQMHSRVLSQHPETNGMGYGFFEAYRNGRRTIGHSGLSPTFRSDLMLIPRAGVGLFVAFNTKPPDNVVDKFMNEFFKAPKQDIEAPPDFHLRAHEYEGTYASTRRSYFGIGTLFGFLVGGDQVKATDRNTLFYRNSEWVEVAPDVFKPFSGKSTIAFLRDEHHRITHIVGTQVPDPRERLDVQQTAMFYATALVLSAIQTVHDFVAPSPWSWAVFLLGLFALLVAFAPRLLPAINPQPSARWLIFLIALANLFILAAIAQTIADLKYRFHVLLARIPWYLAATSWLALISLMLTALAAWCAARAWRKGNWTFYGRLEYTTIVVLAAVFLGWLYRWNLLTLNYT